MADPNTLEISRAIDKVAAHTVRPVQVCEGFIARIHVDLVIGILPALSEIYVPKAIV